MFLNNSLLLYYCQETILRIHLNLRELCESGARLSNAKSRWVRDPQVLLQNTGTQPKVFSPQSQAKSVQGRNRFEVELLGLVNTSNGIVSIRNLSFQCE